MKQRLYIRYVIDSYRNPFPNADCASLIIRPFDFDTPTRLGVSRCRHCTRGLALNFFDNRALHVSESTWSRRVRVR